MMPDFKSGITFSSFPHVQADLQSSCIWHPKMFRRICNPPATCIRIFNPALLFLLLFCLVLCISFFSDYKSLYSMMPDFKSGITLS